MESFDRGLCPRAEAIFALLAKKWNGLILLSLDDGGKCFNELARKVAGLSGRVLSLRVKELEQAGLVSRIVIAEAPIRVRYRLTAKGRDLASILGEIATWASGPRAIG
jgi:DNA-binding HxlR family transcriptional regulator